MQGRTTRAWRGTAVAIGLAAVLASCSDGEGQRAEGPSRKSASAASTPAVKPSTQPSAGDRLDQMMPTAEELPAGWRFSGEKSVGWRDAAPAIDDGGLLTCGALPQEAAERSSGTYQLIKSVGNESGGDGAHFRLGRNNEEQAKRNLGLVRKLLKCWNPKDAGVGDESLSFTTERFAHVVLRVDGIEAQIHTPKKGASPSAEAWADVMARRIRSVLAGEQPTARITPR